jgi:hypothetical protein
MFFVHLNKYMCTIKLYKSHKNVETKEQLFLIQNNSSTKKLVDTNISLTLAGLPILEDDRSDGSGSPPSWTSDGRQTPRASHHLRPYAPTDFCQVLWPYLLKR